MDFRFSPEDEEFRLELQDFLQRELPPQWDGGATFGGDWDDDLTPQLRKKLAQKGWLTMHWPQEYGGQDSSPLRSLIFNEEMAYNRSPGRDILGAQMLGPTLMIYGTEEQKRRFLPPIARAEVQWCQGYSEPEAGSDLASIKTRAVEDGDHFVINGSKIWTTMAHRAEWMMLLARTNPKAPKHQGIGFFLVDMKSPGIEVQPIINMVDRHEFNQVFFDNLRVPKENLVSEKDKGWYVGVTLLNFERSHIDYAAMSRRMLDDLTEYVREGAGKGPKRAGEWWVKDLLAERYMETEVARLMAYRVAWLQSQGQVPIKEASISKVFGSETWQRVTETGLKILGLYGQLTKDDRWAPLHGGVQEAWRTVFSLIIGGGTSEIQRNIIATRGLGLPRG